MPLSEHEQKVLADLEESVSKQDPRFAKVVSHTNVDALRRRFIRWGVVGLIAGQLFMVVFYTQSLPLGLVGLAVMLLSALVIAGSAELAGRAPRSRHRHRSE